MLIKGVIPSAARDLTIYAEGQIGRFLAALRTTTLFL
jgi:hypothetical protein